MNRKNYYDKITVFSERKHQMTTCTPMEEMSHKISQPKEWIVDGIIPVGLSIFAGGSKIGKSYMMLDLCACVADGRDFLGKHTSQHATLYLDLESTWRRPQMRMRQIMGEDAAMPTKLHISTGESGWERIGEGFEEQLTEVIRRNPEIRLVVIDKIKAVSRAEAFGSARVMVPLKRLADKLDIAIVCVTGMVKKTRKNIPSKIMFSKAAIDVCDRQIILHRKFGEDDGQMILAGSYGNNISMPVRFNKDCMRWQCRGDIEN